MFFDAVFFFEQLDLCCVYKISGQSQYSQVKFLWFEKKKNQVVFFFVHRLNLKESRSIKM